VSILSADKSYCEKRETVKAHAVQLFTPSIIFVARVLSTHSASFSCNVFASYDPPFHSTIRFVCGKCRKHDTRKPILKHVHQLYRPVVVENLALNLEYFVGMI
jgi:hypothetical protein